MNKTKQEGNRNRFKKQVKYIVGAKRTHDTNT